MMPNVPRQLLNGIPTSQHRAPFRLAPRGAVSRCKAPSRNEQRVAARWANKPFMTQPGRRPIFARSASVVVLASVLVGCSNSAATSQSRSGNSGDACNNAGYLAVEHAHANRAEVTLCGVVTRVRPARRTRSGEHRVFVVNVDRGGPITIDANLDVMGNFPIHTGESTTIRGEYYYDNNGREGVHWTHHTDRGSHPAGFVILDGTRYD